MPPIVSVIIPAYNRSTTISRAIESVLAQTFPDFQVIIVDDGSTDQTRETVHEFVDERIQLICHDSNLGAAAARNTGMKAATGKYIAWLDSDDAWVPEKLHIQLNALERATQNQKACYTGYERIERNGSRIITPRYTDYKSLFLGCDQAPGSTLVFERIILYEIGYLDTSLIRYEDWDWLLRYCSKFQLLAINQPLASIYYTPQRPSMIMESSASTFVSKYSEILRQYGLYRNIVISRRWMEVASYYAHDHDIRNILRFLVKALVIYPFQPFAVWAWLINNWFGTKISRLFSKGNMK
jgi:glycosyltransferase involved in cell wall biosynthesis